MFADGVEIALAERATWLVKCFSFSAKCDLVADFTTFGRVKTIDLGAGFVIGQSEILCARSQIRVRGQRT